ncbi:MAG TPA: methylcobamide--CoM methyltransferase [Kosmotogaceae bacterium]|nr:methylcobamide--CoM methyltransferase [Kosmotogaceae bacterium]
MNRTTVIPLMGAPGIQLSKTTLKENLLDAPTQYRSISMLKEEFKPDGIFFFMDLTVEAEALGLEIVFPEVDNPYVKEHCIKTPQDLSRIRKNWKGPCGRMEVFKDVAKLMVSNLTGLKGGYVIGPFSLAGELVGVTDFCMLLLDDPEFARQVIVVCTDVITEYVELLFSQGLDVIAVLDPTAVLLSKRQFQEFALPYFSALISRLNKPLIYHICGDTTHIVDYMGKSRAYGLSLDSLVDLRSVVQIVPKEVKIIGNLDPVKVFLKSSPQEVEQETLRLLRDMVGIDNFILSSGCDIPQNTPLENIAAFMKAAGR